MIRVFTIVTLASLALPCFGQVKNGFDLSNSAVDPARIEDGGPGRDGIPAIDQPKFIRAEDATFLRDNDRILGVHHHGIAKAYPIRILDWHEVVNDEFAGARTLITFCPLCNTGMVFDVDNGEVDFTFGVSGLLYNSDVLLYDRQTQSLWSQIISKAISGPLKGLTLNQLPARHTTWSDWREQFPETLVLSTDTGLRRDYRVSPYMDYAQSPQLMFSVDNESREYRRKELVLGISLDDKHEAFPLRELEKLPGTELEGELAGHKLTIIWSKANNSAHAVDVSGSEVPSTLAYWFAWYAFHPDTEVFRADDYLQD